MMKRIIYLLLPLLASCGENSRSSLPTRETVSDVFLQEVLTAKAELKRLQKEFTLAGKVVVDSDRTISYSPLVSGVVVKSYFSLGGRYTFGRIEFFAIGTCRGPTES